MAFKVGEATIFPDVAASYQVMVSPGFTVAVAVKVCNGAVSHWVILPPDIGAAGAALMVRVTTVLVKDGQVPSFDSA